MNFNSFHVMSFHVGTCPFKSLHVLLCSVMTFQCIKKVHFQNNTSSHFWVHWDTPKKRFWQGHLWCHALPRCFGMTPLTQQKAHTFNQPTSQRCEFSKAFPYHPTTQLPLSFPYQFAFFLTSKSNLFKVRVWSPTSGIRKQNWRDHQVLVWWTMELGGSLGVK